MKVAAHLPVEFNRKCRSLNELPRWKTTELRTFLIYVGPIVLLNLTNVAIYKHFLLFHLAVIIFLSNKYIFKYHLFAKSLIDTFVLHCEQLYGLEFYVYKVHMLSHISDDVKKYGCLDNFSAFPFENFLGQLNNLLNSPKHPLKQIINRLSNLTFM